MEERLAEAIAHALQLLEEGNAPKAFHTIRPEIAAPATVASSAFEHAIRALASISRALGAGGVAELMDDVADDPDDLQKLYQLGWVLIEQDVGDLAATVLARADDLAPGDPRIVEELTTAYGDVGLHEQARDAVLKHPALLTSGLIFPYLASFHAILAGDIATAEGLVPRLRAEVTADAQAQFMVGTILEMLARADGTGAVTSLDENDLRGWHLVTTGGLLLHVSPHGFDQGMNGRYAYVQDSPALCLDGIRSVELLLRTWSAVPTRVRHFPDANSEALARALATRLDAELLPWDLAAIDEACVVVAYDLATAPVELLAPLRTKRPGQILWGHACCWCATHPVAADLVTFLYQFNRAPWDAALLADAEGEARIDVPADADPSERARQILASELPEDDELLEDKRALLRLATYENLDTALPVVRRPNAMRRRSWYGSRVRSARFS